MTISFNYLGFSDDFKYYNCHKWMEKLPVKGAKPELYQIQNVFLLQLGTNLNAVVA